MRPERDLHGGGGASGSAAVVPEAQQAALLSAVQAAVQQAAADIRRALRLCSVLLLPLPEAAGGRCMTLLRSWLWLA